MGNTAGTTTTTTTTTAQPVSLAQMIAGASMSSSNDYIIGLLNRLEVMLDRVALGRSPAGAQLTSEGRQIIMDFRELVGDVEILIREKNRDQKYQRLFAASLNLARKAPKNVSNYAQTSSINNVTEGDKLEFKELWSASSVVLREFFFNPELRTMLLDFSKAMKDLAVDQVKTTASMAQPQSQQTYYTTDRLTNVIDTRTAGYSYGTTSPTYTTTAPIYTTTGTTGYTSGTTGISGTSYGGYTPGSYTGYSTTSGGYSYRQDPITHFTNILRVLARNPKYHDFIFHLFNLMDVMRGPGSSGFNFANLIRYSPDLHTVFMESRSVLADFAGPRETDALIDSLENLRQSLSYDANKRQIFSDWRWFISSLMQDPELIDRPEYRQRLDSLINQTKYIRGDFVPVLDALNEVLIHIKNDTLFQKFSEDFTKFMTDLTVGYSENKLSIRPGLASQLREFMIPFIMEEMQQLTIPQISGTYRNYLYVIENIELKGLDVLPDHFNFRFMNELDVNFRRLKHNSHYSVASFFAQNLNVEVNHFKFTLFDSRSRALKDSGYGDLHLRNISVYCGMYFSARNRPMLDPTDIRVKIGKFTFRTRDARHSTLYNLGAKIMGGSLKRTISNKIAEKIKEAVITVNGMLERLVAFAPGGRISAGFKSSLFGMKKKVSMTKTKKMGTSSTTRVAGDWSTWTTGYTPTFVRTTQSSTIPLSSTMGYSSTNYVPTSNIAPTYTTVLPTTYTTTTQPITTFSQPMSSYTTHPTTVLSSSPVLSTEKVGYVPHMAPLSSNVTTTHVPIATHQTVPVVVEKTTTQVTEEKIIPETLSQAPLVQPTLASR